MSYVCSCCLHVYPSAAGLGWDSQLHLLLFLTHFIPTPTLSWLPSQLGLGQDQVSHKGLGQVSQVYLLLIPTLSLMAFNASIASPLENRCCFHDSILLFLSFLMKTNPPMHILTQTWPFSLPSSVIYPFLLQSPLLHHLLLLLLSPTTSSSSYQKLKGTCSDSTLPDPCWVGGRVHLKHCSSLVLWNILHHLVWSVWSETDILVIHIYWLCFLNPNLRVKTVHGIAKPSYAHLQCKKC